MNYYLIGLMTGKKVLCIPNSKVLKYLPIDCYAAIGSIVTFYPLDHLTIWGSGIINNNAISRISGKPNRICAVRGPLTREALIRKGYDCPEVYGDPVLLLPGYYKPKNAEKKHRLGIIPHFIDKDLPIVRDLAGIGEAIVIDVQNYSSWQSFVDRICSCEYIISSSLHGLICSEAYGVPSVWVGFSDYTDGWEFKFLDFYGSIQKPGTTMERIRRAEDFEDRILTKLKNWRPGKIDTDRLLEACPFEIKRYGGQVH